MKIEKQITICKSDTKYILFPESRNEIGLWIAHSPYFVISANGIQYLNNSIKETLQYSNSGLLVEENAPQKVLKELHVKSWNALYKNYKIFSLSLTESSIIITPWKYSQKGMFPDTESKCVFDIHVIDTVGEKFAALINDGLSHNGEFIELYPIVKED